MLKKRIHVHDAKVLIMGLTFKENCPDLRNTRVIDMIDELDQYGAYVENAKYQIEHVLKCN